MTDLERALNTITHREWDTMRASWLDRTALLPTIDSEEDCATCDVLGVHDIWRELKQQWYDAERGYRDALEKYDQECELKISKLPPKKRDPKKELEERRRFDTNQNRLRFLKCVGKECEVPGLPEALFCEGLRLTHKAIHVLGCAETDAESGMRSWSLSSAYHAGLFAGKAIIAFCGIGIIEIEGKTLLLDIFSQRAQSANPNLKRFSYINYRLDHKDIWQSFQRMLGVTLCQLWPKDAVDKIKAVEEKLFARQRNEIHYDSLHWPLADLYEFLTEGPFGAINAWNISAGDINFGREDISLVIAFYLAKMALLLIEDIGRYSNKFDAEISVFRNVTCPERHPFYHGALGV